MSYAAGNSSAIVPTPNGTVTPASLLQSANAAAPDTVYGHILGAIPNNLVNPFLSGNVLSIVLIAAGMGVAIAVLGKKSENVKALHRAVLGLQEVFFGLIKGLIWALPVGIVAFAAQLSAQMSAGIMDSLNKKMASDARISQARSEATLGVNGYTNSYGQNVDVSVSADHVYQNQYGEVYGVSGNAVDDETLTKLNWTELKK